MVCLDRSRLELIRFGAGSGVLIKDLGGEVAVAYLAENGTPSSAAEPSQIGSS